jgi:hypothetical protein
MMNSLKIKSINHPSPADQDLRAIQESLFPILAIVFDETIKSIDAVEPLTVNAKRSFRLNLENGVQIEIGMFDLSTRRLFKGLFKLAKIIEQDSNSIIQQILPVTSDLPHLSHSRSVVITTEAGRYGVVLKTSEDSFKGLTGIFAEPVDSVTYYPDFIIRMDLFANSTNDYRDLRGEAVGWNVKGTLNEFGDLVVKELGMSDEAKIDALRADIKIGSIYLKIQDLLSLRPGSAIEIDWPDEAKASLVIGDRPWTQVKIQLDNGKMSLILPEDATFSS